MDNNEIRKAIKRLSRLSEEEWKLQWGEPENLFLIDLVESETPEIDDDLEELETEIKELETEIKALETKLKEAYKTRQKYKRKLNSKNTTIQQLNNLLEKHKNNTK